MGKRDSLMLRFDDTFSRVYNMQAWLKYELLCNKKLLRNNAKLKVSGKNAEICFVLGNGPSLKDIDFSLIENFPCCTVNLFYKSEQKFTSDYHFFVDPGFDSDEHFKYVQQAYLRSKDMKIIVRDSLYKRLSKEGFIDDRTYFIRPDYAQYKNKVSCNMEKCMSSSLNVIPVAIECAVFMGFKKICLLGCDFNSYAVAKNEHFYDPPGYEERTIRQNIVGDLIRCALVHKQHYALDKYSRSLGLKIINMTQNSLIDAYEKDTLNHVLSVVSEEI